LVLPLCSKRRPQCWSISHLCFTISCNQQIYYPKEDDNDQQRFFTWNSQAWAAANHLDNGHQRDSSNDDNKHSFGFSYNLNPLAIAPAAPRPPSNTKRFVPYSDVAPIFVD